MPNTLKPQYLHKDEAREDIYKFRRTLWGRLRFYAAFVWRFVVLQRPEPLIYGMAVTDRCNLACRGCHVSIPSRYDLGSTDHRNADAWNRRFRN